LEALFAGITHRQVWDLQRLFTYHHDLQREAAARLATLYLLAAHGNLTEKQQADQPREHQWLEAITREYHGKVEDVRRKYFMKVELEWPQMLELVISVQRFTVQIKRRRGERCILLDWNPLARQLDQSPYEYSYTRERLREVCDDRLHLISLAAHAPCPACARRIAAPVI